MYNSAVFTTISVRQYVAFLVAENFVQGADFDLNSGLANDAALEGTTGPNDVSILRVVAQRLQQSTDMKRLEDKECLEAYSGMVNSYADVLMVTSRPHTSNSALYFWPPISTDFADGTTEYAEQSWYSINQPQVYDDTDYEPKL